MHASASVDSLGGESIVANNLSSEIAAAISRELKPDREAREILERDVRGCANPMRSHAAAGTFERATVRLNLACPG